MAIAGVFSGTANAEPGATLGDNYYELHQPAGNVAKGTIVAVHGGAWADAGVAAAHHKDVYYAIGRFRDAGWRVLDVTYDGIKPGHPEIPMNDLRAWYRLARDAFPGQPVCAYGESAGGHMAMMLVAQEPIPPDCVISLEGPSDITEGAVNDPSPEQFPDRQGWSPAFIWNPWPTEVMAAYALNDTVLNYERQTTRFRQRVESVGAGTRVHLQTILGSVPPADTWGHSYVGDDERDSIFEQWLQMLDRHQGAPRAPDPVVVGPDGWVRTCNDAARSATELVRSAEAWRTETAAWNFANAYSACDGRDDGLGGISVAAYSVDHGGYTPYRVYPPDKGAAASAFFITPNGKPIRAAKLAFRGNRVAPDEWQLGIYAGRDTDRPGETLIAGCGPSGCMGVVADGGTFSSSASGAAPRTYTLPDDTRRIDIRVICVKGNCDTTDPSQDGSYSPSRNIERLPAVLSVYSASMQVGEPAKPKVKKRTVKRKRKKRARRTAGSGSRPAR